MPNQTLSSIDGLTGRQDFELLVFQHYRDFISRLQPERLPILGRDHDSTTFSNSCPKISYMDHLCLSAIL
jgi:hypothetical protein